MPTADTRIAVLEKIAENHDKRITDMEDFQTSVVDRLDQKIQMDLASQVNLERTLTRAVTSLDALSTSVKTAADKAETAYALVRKHEVIGATLMKAGAVLSVILGAIWAVFKFVVGQ